MRAMGIDPGSIVTGFGLVDEEDNHLFYITSGTIHAPPRSRTGSKLQFIYNNIEKILHSYRPDAVIIEKGFYSKNVQTVIKLSRVNGVIMLASANFSIPVFEYTPTEIKLSIVGYGAAKKEQVQHMVSQLLRLDNPVESHHAADALAAAICHLHSSRLKELL